MEKSSNSVQESVTTALLDSVAPSRGRVQSALWEKFGGADGIAKRLFNEYESSKPGSPFRGKLLDLMVSMMTRNMEEEEVDLSGYDEPALLNLLKSCLEDDG